MKMDLAQLTTKTNLKMLFENNALQGSPQDWARSVFHAMEELELSYFWHQSSRQLRQKEPFIRPARLTGSTAASPRTGRRGGRKTNTRHKSAENKISSGRVAPHSLNSGC